MLTELTDLASHTPPVKALLARVLSQALGDRPISFDFHRGWNGGWRVRVEVGSTPPHVLEFALLLVHETAVLPLPRPFPASFRRSGFPATDLSMWIETDEGTIIECEAVP